jgi:hypothetical protein
MAARIGGIKDKLRKAVLIAKRILYKFTKRLFEPLLPRPLLLNNPTLNPSSKNRRGT